MAKKPAAKAAAKATSKDGGISMFQRLMLVLAALLLIPFSVPSLVVLLFGMLPTAGAALMDRGPHRYAWLSVGGVNFAGVAPYLLDLWFKGHSLSRAITHLTDVYTWLVILGASSFGWLLHIVTPPVAGAFLQVATQRRIAILRANQRKLVEQWGPDVVGTPTT